MSLEKITSRPETLSSTEVMTDTDYQLLATTVSSQYLQGRYTVSFPKDEQKAYFTLESKRIVVGRQLLETMYQKILLGSEVMKRAVTYKEFVHFIVGHEFGHFFDLYFDTHGMKVMSDIKQKICTKPINNPAWNATSSENKSSVVHKIMNFLDDAWTNQLYLSKMPNGKQQALYDIYTLGAFPTANQTSQSAFYQKAYYLLLAGTLGLPETQQFYKFSEDVVPPTELQILAISSQRSRGVNYTASKRMNASYEKIVTDLIELMTSEDIKKILKEGFGQGAMPHGISDATEDEIAKDIQQVQDTEGTRQAKVDNHIKKLREARKESKSYAQELVQYVKDLLTDIIVIEDEEIEYYSARGYVHLRTVIGAKLQKQFIFGKMITTSRESKDIQPFDLIILTDNSTSMGDYSAITYQALTLVDDVFKQISCSDYTSSVNYATAGSGVSDLVFSVEASIIDFGEGTEAFDKAFTKAADKLSQLSRDKAASGKRKQMVFVITDGAFTGGSVAQPLQALKDNGVIVVPIPTNLKCLEGFTDQFRGLGLEIPATDQEIDLNYIASLIKTIATQIITQINK